MLDESKITVERSSSSCDGHPCRTLGGLDHFDRVSLAIPALPLQVAGTLRPLCALHRMESTSWSSADVVALAAAFVTGLGACCSTGKSLTPFDAARELPRSLSLAAVVPQSLFSTDNGIYSFVGRSAVGTTWYHFGLPRVRPLGRCGRPDRHPVLALATCTHRRSLPFLEPALLTQLLVQRMRA